MKLWITLGLVAVFGISEAGWIDRKAEGWAWYEDKLEPVPEEKVEIPNEFKTAQEQIAEAKKNLEEKLAEAMINPTEDNVMSYMIEQKKWLEQSSIFAHSWAKVLLHHPELDPTASSYPVTQYGIQLQKEIDRENNKHFIANLSRNHGLFFFYEGNSKISQGLSKVIKKFSDKYQWNVVAISVDGTILEEFVNSRADNGISKHLGITLFPALFVINPKNKTAIPIGYGFVALDQIEERILMQFKTKEAEHG